MARTRARTALRPTLISLAVASCFSASAALANPTGANVVRGTAAIHQTGNLLQITNSPNAIINWQSFSIGASEITRFIQQSPSSAVLNRVTTQNPSTILGTLESNGRVFLINPNGILFGDGARIDVGGLVASTLNLSDSDFLAGRMRFTQTAGAGAVTNDGSISTASGGNVYLVGSAVTNRGIITSPQGEVVLAAGNSVELVNPGTPSLRVEVSAAENQALNMGQIIADAGRIGIYAGLITHSGTLRADSAVATADGRIVLKATKTAILESGSVTSASGGASGGSVDIEADVLIHAGSIHADGAQGGTVAVEARNVLSAGRISADGSQGAGGEINVQASSLIQQTSAAHLSADGAAGGGKVTLQSADSVFGSGTLTATGVRAGAVGGEIKVLGNEITLLGAQIDASGDAGGGTVLIGGDFQGANPAVQNAAVTWINFSTTIKADARSAGRGGKVVVWSDRDTQFFGSISARGGEAWGGGGLIEVSSKEGLIFAGMADAGAPNGDPGTVLLDPKFIVIDSAASSGLGGFELLDPNPGANNLFGETVVVLPNGNIVVTDPNDDLVASNSGAVYLYNGTTGALISALTGGKADDQVGLRKDLCGEGCIAEPVIVLSNGNFLVHSIQWNTSAGAVTYASATSGVNGAVSATNSLVGSTADDQIGIGNSDQAIVLLANGNYVVASPLWDNVTTVDAGAVTWA
ncbi:MAG: filamentous hemagglutinin N-terminal domain-containing protein, partial [Burkholderiales bacterium]